MSLPDYYERIFNELEKNDPIQASLENLAFWADGRNPDLRWLKLPAMLGADEQELAQAWFSAEVANMDNIHSFSVLYFSLREFKDIAGREFSDVGLVVYPTASDSWPSSRDCLYSKSDLSSRYLRNIGAVCNGNSRPNYLSSDGYVGFSLCYVSLLARELCKSELILRYSDINPIKVAVGYTSGDILEIMNISSGSISYVRQYA
ncbi:hypothetical protein [uncultured Microbulbifer sp.]|uniref:hypothetical protein n=1 Tax=uncultured Microbulbifer sp. TaxID=348147 RepID=UPI00260B49CF|nr:hypothetical protein [uncultured Microbulbifer sp.]